MSDTQPKLAFDLENDLRALSAMASNLTPYLYEPGMYGHISNDLPELTLGGLLLRLHRLTHLDEYLDAEEQTSVQDARINFEAECSNWAVHYEAKLQHEIGARLSAFEQFINECYENLRGGSANYPVQAEKRTMIKHLVDEAQEHNVMPEEASARLKHDDTRLQQILHEGEFIFSDERLTNAYPRAEYWWLYGYISDEIR